MREKRLTIAEEAFLIELKYKINITTTFVRSSFF